MQPSTSSRSSATYCNEKSGIASVRSVLKGVDSASEDSEPRIGTRVKNTKMMQ